jgi:hypothetical protein
MASTDRLPDDAVRSVAAQIATFLPLVGGPGPAAAAAAPAREVTENLAICFLTAEQVQRPPRDLGALARPSGVWHHQVRTAGAATHFARSATSKFDPAGPHVQAVFESPVAEKIDTAIAWVDKHVKGRATVRLLVVPAYYVHALLVARPGGKDSAVLADQPDGFKQLRYETLYSLVEFLKRLAKEKPGSGIV